MRIMSFTEKWPKLHLELPIEQRPEFTTFRYPRGDMDWWIGEVVQVYFKNRSPKREKLGIAKIVRGVRRELDPYFADEGVAMITEAEAVEDGFADVQSMVKFLEKQYGLDYISRFTKWTLRWVVSPAEGER